MEIFTLEGITALLSILMIDIVLSGDNAIVIALASRNLPKDQQKKAIFWGTGGAILVRVLLTVFVLFLLEIPFLQLIGGILLLWIAYKLLADDKDAHVSTVKGSKSLSAAIQTIIFADIVMSLDNVIAVAGAAKGHVPLIIIGIAISIPIMVWGSQLILRVMERYPIILYIGVAILAWTGGDMILKDKKVQEWLAPSLDILEWVLPIASVVLILLIGYISKKRHIRSA